MRAGHTGATPPPRTRSTAGAAALGIVSVVLLPVLTACGSSAPSAPATSAARSLTAAPESSRFSGEPPSSIASAAASAVASAQAAQASAEAAASSFLGSVSAQTQASRDKATAVLSATEGRGNAFGDVTVTGVPRTTTGGLHAAIVTISNRTGQTLSYAVQVDFVDASGKTVDSTVVWAENLGAGQQAQPVAFSRQPADLQLTPVAAKAQRY